MISDDTTNQDNNEGMKEFNHILQQAAALKTEQLAVDRRKFDSYPEWYQHSMFASAIDRDIRDTAAFEIRMQTAQAYKNNGTDALYQKDYNYALICYGQALGLFKWLKNSDAEWKKKVVYIIYFEINAYI